MVSSGGLDPPQYGWETNHLTPSVDTLETRILDELCRQGKSRSSVVLTADLYGTTEEVEESRPLEWTLVEALLQDLNTKGLVTYRLGAFDVFIQIRPTKLAYKALHLESRWIAVVGPGHQFHPGHEGRLRPGDTTDFRGYQFSAEGIGPIVKEDFIDHCAVCEPEHLDHHRDQLKEMFGTDDL